MKPTTHWYTLTAHFAGEVETIEGIQQDHRFNTEDQTILMVLHSFEYYLRHQIRGLQYYELPIPQGWEWEKKEVYELVVRDDLSIFLTLKLTS